eukprot:2465996-Pleurochrysis_carterae.AAC.1
MEMIEALVQRASEAKVSRAGDPPVVVVATPVGASGRGPPALATPGDSKKGSDAREAGTVWWSASRMSISRRSSASMRRCRSGMAR